MASNANPKKQSFSELQRNEIPNVPTLPPGANEEAKTGNSNRDVLMPYFLCSACDAIYDGESELQEHLDKHRAVSAQSRQMLYQPLRTNEPISAIQQQQQQQQQATSSQTGPATSEGKITASGSTVSVTQSPEVLEDLNNLRKLKKCLDEIKNTRVARTKHFMTTTDVIQEFAAMENALIHDLKHSEKSAVLVKRLMDTLVAKNVATHYYNKTAKKQQCMRELRGSTQSATQQTEHKVDDTNDDQKIKKEETNDTSSTADDVEFDFIDMQCYLDANSEILGRLQTIRNEKPFYGVTAEEIQLSQQFSDNMSTLILNAKLPNGLVL
ncbi:hypothetical protein RFI_14363 [Reticulomyxa filosa]|uniref:C2H2-type domain-containing protein n=1 Tax=Reticulomyxa filosa TaxID=46433 RepID=X6NAN5_RETFI|nr:hypothetical protein RFI_14363 [Reticulomyxa filosa]|eukprot:ETO22829.1 hypothetical protein RFI_14363 [Reticulomyxa filosa]